MAGDAITCEGIVREERRGGLFVVDVTVGGVRREVLARRAGRLFSNHVRCIPGDVVEVQLTPYDLTRGRITYRGRRGEGRT
jgi:translation initiation factor IF-1